VRLATFRRAARILPEAQFQDSCLHLPWPVRRWRNDQGAAQPRRRRGVKAMPRYGTLTIDIPSCSPSSCGMDLWPAVAMSCLILDPSSKVLPTQELHPDREREDLRKLESP
jgi:hypothetical protein